jgi:3-oxoacyl-[acyl-carrier-protein] synthase-3
MFNFGSGASAVVLEADAPDRARATIRASAAETDGSFSTDVVMPAGGSLEPPSRESVAAGRHALTVTDPEGMKERLADVSAPAFLSVADDALADSGYGRADLDFVALTHMKRSFHDHLLDRLGVDEAGGYYLDEFGHVQSADQTLALDRGIETGRVDEGDLVLFLAAGTGYTWAATVLEWHG